MCPHVFEGNLSVVSEQVYCCSIIDWHSVMSHCQLKWQARSHTLARETAKLSASPSNFPSSGDIALLHSFVAISPVLGLSKLRTAWERPRPKAKAGTGGAGTTGGCGCGAGRAGGAAAAAGWAGSDTIPTKNG